MALGTFGGSSLRSNPRYYNPNPFNVPPITMDNMSAAPMPTDSTQQAGPDPLAMPDFSKLQGMFGNSNPTAQTPDASSIPPPPSLSTMPEERKVFGVPGSIWGGIGRSLLANAGGPQGGPNLAAAIGGIGQTVDDYAQRQKMLTAINNMPNLTDAERQYALANPELAMQSLGKQMFAPKQHQFLDVDGRLVQGDLQSGDWKLLLDRNKAPPAGNLPTGWERGPDGNARKIPGYEPDDLKAPTTNMDGTQQWNADNKQWEEIPGAMDRYRSMHPQKAGGVSLEDMPAYEDLTPPQQHSIDLQAYDYIDTGKAPPARNGQGQLIRELSLQRAYKLMDDIGIDPSQVGALRADMKGNIKSLQNMTSQRAQMEIWNTKLETMLQEADRYQKLLGNGQFPVLNEANIWKLKQSGDQNLKGFATSVVEAKADLAKVLAGGTGNQQATEGANKRAEGIFSVVDSPAAWQRALDTAQVAVKGARSGYDDQIQKAKDQIRYGGRMKQPESQPSGHFLSDISNGINGLTNSLSGFGKGKPAQLTATAPQANPAQQAQGQTPINLPTDQASAVAMYNSLPPGTEYITPDGRHKFKPGQQ